MLKLSVTVRCADNDDGSSIIFILEARDFFLPLELKQEARRGGWRHGRRRARRSASAVAIINISQKTKKSLNPLIIFLVAKMMWATNSPPARKQYTLLDCPTSRMELQQLPFLMLHYTHSMVLAVAMQEIKE